MILHTINPSLDSPKSSFLSLRLCTVSIPSIYKDQLLIHFLRMQAFAIEHFGWAWLKRIFSIFQDIYEEKICTLCDFIPYGKNAIDGCIKRSNYLSIGYIHRYCTVPSRIASRGKWTARWTITSKNAGGKNLSSMHSIRTIRSSNVFMCKPLQPNWKNSL